MSRYETVVVARCIGCGHRREIRAGEVPQGSMPMCDRCYCIMVAESAERRLDTEGGTE